MSELHTPLDELGTPRPRATQTQVSLKIDGQQIQVDAGSSVMRAAALMGINVPKLCATDSLDAFGSCRMCLVEIERLPGCIGQRRSGNTNAVARIAVRIQRLDEAQDVGDLLIGCIDCTGYHVDRRQLGLAYCRAERDSANRKSDHFPEQVDEGTVTIGGSRTGRRCIGNALDCRIDKNTLLFIRSRR